MLAPGFVSESLADFALQPSDLVVLDRRLRAQRFKPDDLLVDSIQDSVARMRRENGWSTREAARRCAKQGLRGIWLTQHGTPFLGVQQDYLKEMGTETLDEALAALPDDDGGHPGRVRAIKKHATASQQ